MSGVDYDTLTEGVLEAIKREVKGPSVPPVACTFDLKEVSSFAADVNTFWPSAFSSLHRLVSRDNAVAEVSVLLDLAIAVHRRSKDSKALDLFALQEEALQVLPLSKMRQMITFLELRREEWVKYAQGEASIVLLRTGRALLNRLEPKLHAKDTGRVTAYLALGKGIAHASRVNRKGLFNPSGTEIVADSEFSVAYAVNALQSPATLATFTDLEQFLNNVLQRVTRLTLESQLKDAKDWAALTWEELEKTLNGLTFVFLLAFALPVVRASAVETATSIIERLEARLDKIFASIDIGAAVERLGIRESEWSNWRQQQYTKPEKAPVYPPTAGPSAEAKLTVPALAKSLGNENLTRLWAVDTGLARFEENVDWAAKAEEFEAKSKDDASHKFMALRCRPLTELISVFGSAPEKDYDMTEWESRLPKEQPAPLREPVKRATEQPEPAPKRARISYEEVERSASVERQRAMASTARPLPY